ncbi:unnamed protein product [Spirodela intermedia]|uniref:Serine acetyltransferase N-terminal domain-containing protein n=1 Tax=Spirodela intermedia TaxID=51605 RepID=A0A7I8J7R7_SPIIN|nr:unnamed protein product [Spirodela intermedia]CAA6666090.1 unnamed protein product [Spirodela intermedia]
MPPPPVGHQLSAGVAPPSPPAGNQLSPMPCRQSPRRSRRRTSCGCGTRSRPKPAAMPSPSRRWRATSTPPCCPTRPSPLLSFHLANKLSSSTLLSTLLYDIFLQLFSTHPNLGAAAVADMLAVRHRDPACESFSHCLLNYKGFLAVQAHRVSHILWSQARRPLALALQSRISDVFAVDIHPAARIGKGILLDHATGVVVGETAVIGNNVSILHHVTLGGTGKAIGDRHPKIGDGIGAGSLVLIDVPPRTTAVGNPARLIGGKGCPSKHEDIPGESMDHTSFISQWSDYVI